MKIVFAGNNKRAVETLKYLVKKKTQIKLVLAHYKKDKNEYFENLKKIASNLKLKCIAPKNINNKKTSLLLKKIKPDLMVLCGYSQNILKEHIYSIPKYGTWNLHASDLPKYRGAAPLNWAIINGDKKVAASIIKVNQGIDTGDIIGKKFIKLSNRENIKTLSKKINHAYPKLLLESISKLKSGKLKPKKQNENIATYYSKRFPKDSEIFFKKMDAHLISKIIKSSVFPYSGAFFVHKKKKFILSDKVKVLRNYFGIPGRVIKRGQKNLIIVCKSNAIFIEDLYLNKKKIFYINKYFKLSDDLS